MSSPLSSLKKPRKSPLPMGARESIQRTVPYRNPDYTADESKLLEEITGGMAAAKMKQRDPIAGGLPKIKDSMTKSTRTTANPSGLSDIDLMSSMMSRIAALEARVQYQAKEIIEKDKKIKILEDKIRIVQKAKDAADFNPTKTHELEKKCLLLQQQVHEMENFLADYGMAWVGEQANTESSRYNDNDLESLAVDEDEENDLWRPETSYANYNGAKTTDQEFHVDYNLILENIKELNVLAGEGVAKIQHTTDGARLKMPDPIQLTLYANGILLFSGPFRPFTEPLTRQCVQDLMDGYFPSELQARYPDGIPFAVTDKRDVYFKEKNQLKADAFRGTGQVLGGDTKPSRLVPSNLDKATMIESRIEESELPGPKMSVEQFLNRLPQSVIKEGKIIDIRGSLSDKLQASSGSPNNVTLVETEVVQEMKERLQIDKSKRPPTPRDITTLRIKSESGDQTYVLKMHFNDTVGHVRQYIDKLRPPGSPSYKIMTTFPNKVYADDSQTLNACGLTPNAALHLRPLR